jgi:hypothetical protein
MKATFIKRWENRRLHLPTSFWVLVSDIYANRNSQTGTRVKHKGPFWIVQNRNLGSPLTRSSSSLQVHRVVGLCGVWNYLREEVKGNSGIELFLCSRFVIHPVFCPVQKC